jgi:hypothetical protein
VGQTERYDTPDPALMSMRKTNPNGKVSGLALIATSSNCGSGFPAAIRHSGSRRRRISGIQGSRLARLASLARLAFPVFSLCSMLFLQRTTDHCHEQTATQQFRNPKFEIRNHPSAASNLKRSAPPTSNGVAPCQQRNAQYQERPPFPHSITPILQSSLITKLTLGA